MKKTIITLASAIVAMALSSCFQHEMTITLNKDGSGTVVEETRMSAQMLATLTQIAAGFGAAEGEAEDPTADLLSENKAKDRAKELGEGVTIEKIEPVEKNGSKGARVTYAFNDINKLNVDVGSGMKSMAEDGGQEKKESPIGFSYKDGKLTIRMPEPEKENGEAAAGELDEQGMAMMKGMFSDMKMSMKLVIAPGIAETNATHRDGDTITLMSIDFGKLVDNPESLKKLAATQHEQDPAARMAVLKGIDGAQVEAQSEVTVTLK